MLEKTPLSTITMFFSQDDQHVGRTWCISVDLERLEKGTGNFHKQMLSTVAKDTAPSHLRVVGTGNYLEEMPSALEKISLCISYFNFSLKMNSMSAEPEAFQLTGSAGGAGSCTLT